MAIFITLPLPSQHPAQMTRWHNIPFSLLIFDFIQVQEWVPGLDLMSCFVSWYISWLDVIHSLHIFIVHWAWIMTFKVAYCSYLWLLITLIPLLPWDFLPSWFIIVSSDHCHLFYFQTLIIFQVVLAKFKKTPYPWFFCSGNTRC